MAERIWIGEQLFNISEQLQKIDSRIQFFRSILVYQALDLSPDYEKRIKGKLSELYEKYTEAHAKRAALLSLIELKK